MKMFTGYQFVFCLFLIFCCCNSKNKALEQSELIGAYGDKLSTNEVYDMKDLETLLIEKDSAFVKYTGNVLGTCAMKGCWMNLAIADEQEMRVTFKDYGFFVPKEGMEGKKAIVEGYVKKVVTDVETLRHFAEDAGKTQEEIAMIIEPKEEIAFVASGVIIRENNIE